MDCPKPPAPQRENGTAPIPNPSRAERLLEAMYPVFSHDLSNQLVIVQSLANLLEIEERQNLSTRAQDYLTRLTGASQRAGRMVQFLKQMVRVSNLKEPTENIQLSYLAREIQAEINQLFPGRSFRYEMRWKVPTIRAGRRAFYQALVELIRSGIDSQTESVLELRVESRRRQSGTEIEVSVSSPANCLAPTALRADNPMETRLGLLLVRELANTWGGALELSTSTTRFEARMLIPD